VPVGVTVYSSVPGGVLVTLVRAGGHASGSWPPSTTSPTPLDELYAQVGHERFSWSPPARTTTSPDGSEPVPRRRTGAVEVTDPGGEVIEGTSRWDLTGARFICRAPSKADALREAEAVAIAVGDGQLPP
jgi:hypothetical protein